MQQVITAELDAQLVKDVDTRIKTSSFRNRTHLIEYSFQKFAYEKKLVKHKFLILYLTILLCFALMFVLIAVR